MDEHNTQDPHEAGIAPDPKKGGVGKWGHAFLIGLFIGIGIFAAVKKGLGFFTLLPFFLAYLLLRKGPRPA